MWFSSLSRLFCGRADADTAASVEPQPQNHEAVVKPEKKPAEPGTAPSTLGQNWPPNLRSRETDWFVMPEDEPKGDADRPML